MTSPETLSQVERACAELLHGAHVVSFTTIAARTGISRTSLYRDDTLRAVIEEYRARTHDARSLSGVIAEVGHLRIAVEALAEKVRRHDEQLRRLNRTRKIS